MEFKYSQKSTAILTKNQSSGHRYYNEDYNTKKENLGNLSGYIKRRVVEIRHFLKIDGDTNEKLIIWTPLL